MNQVVFYVISLKTRIHSSGMRNARLLTISQHALCRRGVSTQGGVCPGDVCSGCLPGGVCPGGVCQGGVCPLGVCLPRGCLPWGVSTQEEWVCPECLPLVLGVYPSMQWGRPPCGQTDTCENITFANFAGGNNPILIVRSQITLFRSLE